MIQKQEITIQKRQYKNCKNDRENDQVRNGITDPVIKSTTKILRMEPKQNEKSWFNDICKCLLADRN